MDYLRTLREEEKEFLTKVYEDCKTDMPTGRTEVCWLNLHIRNEFTLKTFAHNEALHQFVLRLLEEAYEDYPEQFPARHILNYGFIVNPQGSTKTQHFHCDYSETSSNLFIPMTKVTVFNAPQFLPEELKIARLDGDCNYGRHPEDIMEEEGVDFLVVNQVISKPWTLLRLNPHTPHRGIPNRDNYDRLMFFVTIDPVYKDLSETTTYNETLAIHK